MMVRKSVSTLLALWLTTGLALADQGQTVDNVEYSADVLPILKQHCTRCHGAEKRQSGLRLDSARMIREGGDSGSAVVPGEAGDSLLFKAVTGSDDSVSKMPPEGPGLTGPQVALLRAWIEHGAQAPADDNVAARKSDHWAFRVPVRPQMPAVRTSGWSANPIDYFVLTRMESEGIAPSPLADRATLLRRLSLDLLGIPPSIDEVEAFERDRGSDAYERMVDRLLASPHYGERWGRHWLDAARYADSNGFTRDFGREMFRYREWVIDAINRDLPFDRFVIEQIAGDMLPGATQDQIVATGFHRNTLINEEGGTDPEQFRVDAVADRVATTGTVFLGLTLGCARCHEHKYDPISQREYYQLFAFLNNCDEPTIEVPYDWQVREGVVRRRDEIRQRVAELEKRLADRGEAFDREQIEWEKSITPEQRAKLPGPTQEALMKTLASRTNEEKSLVAGVFKGTEVARNSFPEVDQIARLGDTAPRIPTAMVMHERTQPRNTHIHRRGNFLDAGRLVTPAVPSVLHALPVKLGQPNRLDFARWLVAEDNPLTARVIANRTWQRFFGRGIVETEDDFGIQGELPTHPGLLDWLATELVRQKWSIKQLHRLIVTSSTYRQSSRHRSDLAESDPANRLFARQSRVRLEAEIVRDSALAVSGLLTRKFGGPSVFPPQPEGVFEFTQDPKPWNTEAGEDRFRRGMYTHFWRSSPYPSLMVFDFPNSNVTCTRRLRSNTPLQSLTLANDTQYVECARAVAARILREGPSGPDGRAVFAFRLCLAREPNLAEREMLIAHMREQHAAFEAESNAARGLVGSDGPWGVDMADAAAWTAAARVLLNLDEFITRE
jgi:mono/diheme cytochrome c family protein